MFHIPTNLFSILILLLVTVQLCLQFLHIYTSPDTFLYPSRTYFDHDKKSSSITPSLAKWELQPKLRLRDDNTFSITIFTDLHFGEDESTFGPEQDRKSRVVMRGVLEKETPDFVVINGDLITGENTFLENSTKYVDQIVEPMVEKRYPWASTYGNHDTQYNLSREALYLEESKYNLSYTQHSPDGVGGVTNYWVPIFHPLNSNSTGLDEGGVEAEDEDESPIAILYFFDSLGGENFQRSWLFRWMPNYVVPTAVSWFKSQSSLITSKYGVLPSLAFVHIPPTPFLKTQKKFFPKKGGKDVHFPGLNDDVPVDEQGQGRWFHRDRGFVNALKGLEGLHSVYSGHDHGDSWCGVWEEEEKKKGLPFMCFCKRTGHGGYGDWNRGSRMLGLRFEETGGSVLQGGNGTQERLGSGAEVEMKVDTWVRMESGAVIQSVSLNETYGIDIYPADDGEL